MSESYEPESLLMIPQALAAIKTRLRTAAGTQSPPALIAVSKTHGVDAVLAALQAGQRLFGENRVQEAADKFPPLRQAWPDLELHLIGPLQTNKVEEAVRLFDVIQTLDRPKLAIALAAAMEKIGRRPRLFIQVNTGEESQKAGVEPHQADDFIADCRAKGLVIQGLMCIPPSDEDPAPHFSLLGKIAARNQLPALSMGMSGDFETAARLGATYVRIGSAIFGARSARA